MATIIVIGDDHHLRGKAEHTLCGHDVSASHLTAPDQSGDLTCPECAKIALDAISLSTKKERKEWRDL